MKNTVIFFFSILLLFSCTKKEDIRLQQAEVLMNSSPDSALHLLQKTSSEKLPDRLNKAIYALLMSQALDKKADIPDSDSLVTIATDYFDHSDPVRAGYAWLYRSKIAAKNEETKKQAHYLLKAGEFMELTDDPKLSGLIYCEKGNRYKEQNRNDSAIAYYNKAYACFHSIKDYRNSVIALLNTVSVFEKINNPDSVSFYNKLVENNAKQSSDRLIISTVYRSIGISYFQQKKYHLALWYFKKAPDTRIEIYDSNKNYLIGDAFIKLNRIDSAKYYLQKVTELNEMAPDYYRLWELISEKEGNKEKTIYYAHKVIDATDSLYNHKLEISFAGLEKKYKYQKIRLSLQQLTIKNNRNQFLLLLSLLVILSFALAVLLGRLRVKQKEANYQKEIANKKQQLLLQNESLLRQQQETLFKERENKVLLEKQLKLQNILLSNIGVHKTNMQKRPQFWRDGSDELIEKQYQAFLDELRTLVDMMYNDFTNRLTEKHPALTEGDISICCLLIAGFDTGMIATVFNIQVDSINKQRYRLRTRLGIPKQVNLVEYLQHI